MKETAETASSLNASTSILGNKDNQKRWAKTIGTLFPAKKYVKLTNEVHWMDLQITTGFFQVYPHTKKLPVNFHLINATLAYTCIA